ncbi:Uma2 family endonuclease [Leptolyngbya sp. PL-A3]|uniref:Uma2 family endonuclease n=1 Tax=Leptolyngbya sp. PL-A3 TaxID=2933911 RepID=UPI003297B48A
MNTLIPAKFSVDAYHKMIAAGALDDRRVELLNGELIEMPSEGAPHAGFSSDAGDYLRDLLQGQAKVREGHPITIPQNDSEPQPDLAIVQQLGEVYDERHPQPEEVYLLIEFSDTSLEKDLDPKAKLYAAAGIQEYWVVDLRSKVLVVHRTPSKGRYGLVQEINSGSISPLAFSNIKVSVERILKLKR